MGFSDPVIIGGRSEEGDFLSSPNPDGGPVPQLFSVVITGLEKVDPVVSYQVDDPVLEAEPP